MAPNCTSSYCILHHHVPHILRTEKKPILRKNALDKAMKTTDFLNPDPYAHIFLIFYVMKWEACKKHFCCTKVLKGAYATISELRDQLSFFPWNIILTSKNSWHTNMVIQTWVLSTIFFQKWTKWDCHFTENNWQYFLPIMKFQLSSKY